MNAIILSALWGVVMMYTGVVTRNTRNHGVMAIIGIILLTIAAWLEFVGVQFFSINLSGMMSFAPYSLVFMMVMFVCTLLYFILSGPDMKDVGDQVSDYYALIFFVLTGVSIVAAFKTLLMLFIGIEIMTIPLYILAASDK